MYQLYLRAPPNYHSAFIKKENTMSRLTRIQSILHVATYLVLFFAIPSVLWSAEKSIVWKIKKLTVDTNEGIDLADVNKDGKLDIIAGRNWYAAPDFIPK
ncbi:hypothetical protein MNBD_PLANCTO02-512, partial [hydrothermal vent metagenome]